MPASSSNVNGIGRECSRCQIFKPWDQFYFQSRGINGRSPRCADCAKELSRGYYVKRPSRPDVICQVCGKVVPGRGGIGGQLPMYCLDGPCKRIGGERKRRRVSVMRSCQYCGKALTVRGGPPTCVECHVDKRDPEKRRAKEARRRLRKYGMGEGDDLRMLAAQGGECAICGTTDPGGPHGVWAIDHCHGTGSVRGILCHRCNLGLGQFGDDPNILQQAVEYLRRRGFPKAV